MVPTLAKLEEPNVARLWRGEETTIVSCDSVPETIGGDKVEPSIIPLVSEPQGSTFEVEVKKELPFLL